MTDIKFTQRLTNLVFVNSKADLPTAISGVITFVSGVTYFFTTSVDLTGDRILCTGSNVIIGGGPDTCLIKSTGLSASVALITSTFSLPMRNIRIEHGTALNLDATANAGQGIDWFGVTLTNCATVGTIKSYANIILSDCVLSNSANMTFDGTIGTVAFNTCLIDGRTGQTSIILPSTLTITRRFRANLSAFISESGETALSVSTSASIPVESYLLETCNFSGGGTYISGVQHSDNKAKFTENKGIQNSASISYTTMISNATATVISAINTPVKVAGTTVNSSVTQRFDNSVSNKIVYTGAVSRLFAVVANFSATSGNNDTCGFFLYKNGVLIPATSNYSTMQGNGRAENIIVQCLVELQQNDYIELYCQNNTATFNITVTDMQITII